MKPSDIKRIKTPNRPSLSPDGRSVVFAETGIEGNAYVSILKTAPTDGSAPAVAITQGPRDVGAAWSPAGDRIAFMRSVEGGQPQLWVMRTDGSDATCLTDHELGVGCSVTTRHPRGVAVPVWSPDGKRIAYLARVADQNATGGSHRRITRLRYRIEQLGFVNDRRAQIFVHDFETGETRCITDLRWDYWDVSWHPDGQHLVAGTAQHADSDLDEANDVVLLGLDGSERILTRTGTTVNQPAVSPDGEHVLFAGIALPDEDRSDSRARNMGIWRVSLSGGIPERLTPAETFDVDDGCSRPFPVDATGVLSGNLVRGSVPLMHVPFDGSAPRQILGGKRQVSDYCLAGETICAVVSDSQTAGELVAIRNGTETRLTDYGAELARCGLVKPEEIEATAPDGYPVHGWLYRPSGPGPHPLLLFVHGGPDIQMGESLVPDAQIYVDAGYAVIISNPRGSAGYGEKHARVICGNVGSVDADDLVALHRAVCERPDIDETRTGVLGGSYGGFMTAWLAAHHGDLFKAALSERGVYSYTSMMGTSDLGSVTASMIGHDPEKWVLQSPLTHAEKIDIPLLIMHWEGDRRVPFEQSQQLFAALRMHRKDVEYVVFPGGSHTSAKSGPPDERIERLHVILEWFERRVLDGTRPGAE